MTKGAEGRSEERGGTGKAKAGGKGKRERKSSSKSATKKARERASEAIDPKVAIIAKDPLRSEIVAVAIQRLYSPSEFARDAGISVGIASYAFRVLREHGILELVKEERVRGFVKRMHRANEAALIGDRDWGALASVLRPGIIGATIGNFNRRFAQAEQTGKLYERDDACIYWAPRELDEEAWIELVKATKWWIEESERLAGATANRKANGESDGQSFKTTIGIFTFPSPTHSEVKAHEREERKKGKGKAPSAKVKPKAKGKRRKA